VARPFVLDKMTWPEVEAARQSIQLVVVPVGSTEQHGPNTTFDTDTVRAYGFCKLLEKAMHPRLLVAPPVTVGISYHHLKFPGSLTLKPETMIQYLVDLAWSFAQHGFKRLLFINGHGGNRPVLELACVRIKHELGMVVGWAGLMGDTAPDVVAAHARTPVNGHACEIETSQLLYLGGADSIRNETLRAADIKLPGWSKLPIKMPRGFDEITERGDLGDATQHSMKIGRAVTEAVKDRLVEAIERQLLTQPV